MGRSPRRAVALVAAAVLAGVGGTASASGNEDILLKRSRWAYEERAFPAGRIPPGARSRVLRSLENARRSQVLPSVANEVWRPIGPRPIRTGEGTAAVAGRVTSIAVDPGHAERWLVGTAAGGIWRTEDAGTTFTPTSDDQASLAIGALAFCPSDGQRAYAGTGEANFSGDAYAGEGLLWSSDGGGSWQLREESSPFFAGATTSDIKVKPESCGELVVATAANVRGCRHGFGHQPDAPLTGIFRSLDGGVSWSATLPDAEATDIEVNPLDFAQQYAGVANPDPDPACATATSGGLYRSFDSGATWNRVRGPWTATRVGRIELAISGKSPSVLYASIEDASVDASGNHTSSSGSLVGLYRTDNAWDESPTWSRINVDPPDLAGYCAPACWYHNDLIVDPMNADLLYAGGAALWKFDGSKWTNVSGPIHVDQHALAWAGGRLIAGNDGGVWSTTDAGQSWTAHNEGLAITQFYAGSVSPDGELVLGGSQNNGTDKWLGCDDDWSLVRIPGYGYGGYSAISPAHPREHWAVSAQELTLFRTTDGATLQPADQGIEKTGVRFIAPIAECASDPDVFLAGTDNLWRTKRFFSDATPAWSKLNPEMGAAISAIAFSAADSTCRTYAFGTTDGHILMTANDAQSWRYLALRAEGGDDPDIPDRAVTDLAFDPVDSNVLYATLSGFDDATPGKSGHVFRTRNALGPSPSWDDITPCPTCDIPHNAVLVDPQDRDVIYVGADLGVWRTTDGAATWTEIGSGQGLPNAPVLDLAIDPTSRRVVAFTHGRGAFVLAPAEAVPCDDGKICTTDACEGIAGCTHRAADCNDQDPCTDDRCAEPTGCFHETTCDMATGCPVERLRCYDGDACTTDRCGDKGECLHEPVSCVDGDACTTDNVCNHATGCVYRRPELEGVLGGLSTPVAACDTVPPSVDRLITASRALLDRAKRAKHDRRFLQLANRSLEQLERSRRKARLACRSKAVKAGKITEACCESLRTGIEEFQRQVICLWQEKRAGTERPED